MYKLMITGSRDWKDEGAINLAMAQCWIEAGRPKLCTLVHGGATGADAIGASIAQLRKWEVVEYPADWDGLGKRAGIVRNIQMLESEPDHVLGFIKKNSIGTFHALLHSQKLGIPRTVIFG